MRIIAGKYRGLNLSSPMIVNKHIKNATTRPSASRLREAIFNIISHNFVDSLKGNVIDIFAGTGAMGLEAVSRGAKSCLFIENEPQVFKVLLENIKKINDDKISNKLIAKKIDALNLPQSNIRFSLIIIDAPYNKGLSDITIEKLIDKNYLDQNAILSVEIGKNEELKHHPSLEIIATRVYGISKVCFLRYIM